MAKKDMSFIKMVANDEDFHREVYEHGQENLLVSALPPCVRSSDACADAWRPLSPAVVDIYSKVWGPCLMLDNYLYNTYFGALALAHHHHLGGCGHPAHRRPACGRHERRWDGREVCASSMRQDPRALRVPGQRVSTLPVLHGVHVQHCLGLRRRGEERRAAREAMPQTPTQPAQRRRLCVCPADPACALALLRMAKRSSMSRGLRSLS